MTLNYAALWTESHKLYSRVEDFRGCDTTDGVATVLSQTHLFSSSRHCFELLKKDYPRIRCDGKQLSMGRCTEGNQSENPRSHFMRRHNYWQKLAAVSCTLFQRLPGVNTVSSYRFSCVCENEFSDNHQFVMCGLSSSFSLSEPENWSVQAGTILVNVSLLNSTMIGLSQSNLNHDMITSTSSLSSFSLPHQLHNASQPFIVYELENNRNWEDQEWRLSHNNPTVREATILASLPSWMAWVANDRTFRHIFELTGSITCCLPSPLLFTSGLTTELKSPVCWLLTISRY